MKDEKTAVSGLTSSEVERRKQAGQSNEVELTTSRPYRDIIKSNVFNPVNIVLYLIAFGMLLVGDTRTAVTTVGLVVFNAIIGVTQEIRAKRQLDQIALLSRSQTAVIRDGQEQEVYPEELVLGDILIIRPGDQIPVDGLLVGDGRIEVDESALTGESDLILKSTGDTVLSGSFSVTGRTMVEATGVGEASFANDLTKNAREYTAEQTPLQREVNRILRILLLIVMFFAVLMVLGLIVLEIPISAWLQMIAVIVGTVSVGLLTLIILNYSWGAVRIGQKGGLVQQLNAVESLSNVTVLCTDKTGTLTANKIKYADVYPIGIEKEALKRSLAEFARSASSTNKTSEAVIDGLAGDAQPASDEVPFSSARKWSAVAFEASGTYVMGALEMMEPYLPPVDMAVRDQVSAWSNQGLRVLAFAGNEDVSQLHDADGEPQLPPLTLLGLISFSDELRPHLEETLQAFQNDDVQVKVISGDNPQTVAALARQAGFPGDLRVVSGPELALMSDAEFSAAAAETTVFGRITPQQKERLVSTLRDLGEYVAMIGDGVNDVLSLKKANMGIAMESGSTATRSVAAMILLDDSFEAMPAALSEGQRINNSIQNILKLFMVTVFALLMLIIAITVLGMGFPFTALQNTALSFFARGAPPFILAISAVAIRQRTTLADNIIHFTMPASILIFLFGLLIYMGAFFLVEEGVAQIKITPQMMAEMERTAAVDPGTLTTADFQQAAVLLSAQTSLLVFFVFSGVLLMLFAEPPVQWFEGGAPYHGKNWIPAIAAVVLLLLFSVIMILPGVRSFFQLIPLPGIFYAAIALMTVLWVVVQRWMYRSFWLERFLDLEERFADSDVAPHLE